MLKEILEQIDESNKNHASSVVALLSLLVSKGIVTEEEWLRAKAMAVSQVDQAFQRKKEELEKENDCEMSELFEQFFGCLFDD